MAEDFQFVFTAAVRPARTLTFVNTTNDRASGQLVAHTSAINSHLAKHGRAKRIRKLIEAHGVAAATKSVMMRGTLEWKFRAEKSKETTCDFTQMYGDHHGLAFPNSSGFDKPLLSALDPFIQLPLEVSSRDKSLLAYYLTDGKQQTPGTSKNPQHCVCLRLARDWLQYSPLHTTHTLMLTETIIGKLSGKGLSRSFYRKRMESLAYVQEVIASSTATYSYKLYAIMALVWTSYTSNSPDLQTHLEAVNTLLRPLEESPSFVAREPEGPTLRPQWLVGIFLVTEYYIASFSELCSAKARFASDLRSICTWHEAQRLHQSKEPSTWNHQAALQELHDFLAEPIVTRRFGASLPFAIVAAPFFCCYSVVLTFSMRDMNRSEALEYLYYVQAKLSMIDHGCSFGGTALSHMLGDARWATTIVSIDEEHTREVMICRSLINALRIYYLISTEVRCSITQTLFYMIFDLVSPSGRDESTTAKEFEAYQEGIESQWWRRHQFVRHEQGRERYPSSAAD